MINVKNVKHSSIYRTNVTDHQDACTVNEIIRPEIINVNYLCAKTSNHAITWLLDAATVKMRTSQIAQCVKHIRKNRRRNESSSTQKKESSIQTVIWLINRRANSHEKNKSSSDFRTTQKTAYWRKNRNRTSLRLKIAQRTTLFQRSRAFLIKSLSVLPFLDVQDNKSRSVVTILSEVTRLLRYLRYKAIASSIFYQKE